MDQNQFRFFSWEANIHVYLGIKYEKGNFKNKFLTDYFKKTIQNLAQKLKLCSKITLKCQTKMIIWRFLHKIPIPDGCVRYLKYLKVKIIR